MRFEEKNLLFISASLLKLMKWWFFFSKRVPNIHFALPLLGGDLSRDSSSTYNVRGGFQHLASVSTSTAAVLTLRPCSPQNTLILFHLLKYMTTL